MFPQIHENFIHEHTTRRKIDFKIFFFCTLIKILKRDALFVGIEAKFYFEKTI